MVFLKANDQAAMMAVSQGIDHEMKRLEMLNERRHKTIAQAVNKIDAAEQRLTLIESLIEEVSC